MTLKTRILAYASKGFRETRRLVILLVGVTVVLFGFVLIVTPGPAFIVIPAGLAILGLEFAWARRWLKKMRTMVGLGKTGRSGLFTAENAEITEKDER